MAFSIEKYHFRNDSMLKGLPSKEFKLLKESIVRMEFKKDKSIFKEGYYSKGVYILRKGKVKIFQLNKSGEEQIAYIYRKGELMGYRPLLSNEVHPISATALEDCIVSFIPQKGFLEVLQNSTVLGMRLLDHLAHEFTVWINTFSILAQQPVRERVALILLILNEKYRRGDEPHPVINLSRENMARYARTTPETLIRILKHFKDEKIIASEGRRITVLRPTELEKIAEFY